MSKKAILLVTIAGAIAVASAQQRILSLDECVLMAWGEQPLVAIAEKNLRLAEERVKSIRANLFPQVLAGYQFRRYLSTRIGFQIGVGQVQVQEPIEFKETSLTISQLLFDTFQTPLQIRQAKAQANASSQAYERTRAEIALQVAQQYFEVLRARALVKLQERVLERAKRLLEAAEAGYKAGTAAKLDVLRAQVQVRNAEVDLLAAQNQEKVAILTLRNLMGVGDDFLFDIVEPAEERYQPPSLTECLAQALRQRPEIREAEWQRESAQTAKQLARINTLPVVNINGSYNRYPSTTRITDKEWAINFIVSYPIFDGGRVRAELEQAKLQVEQSELNLKRTLDNIRLQVQQSYSNWQNAFERLNAAQEAVKEASETARLTEEAYKAGAVSLIDVINSQVALAQAETQEIQARYDLYRAIYALRYSLGEINKYFAQKVNRSQ
ncbi:MAG: TolC family protein [Armatimonadetes bacterium]|nr:TolC family protein [Armatimonadota bacterium]MDW8028844.1 TolC family protein [Armatimonadota bacterium]